MGMAVEPIEDAQNGNEDGSGDGAGTGTGAMVETRGETQDGNGVGSEDGNVSSSGDGNGDEDGNGNGNDDRLEEGGREAKKRKKPHNTCRRHVRKGGDLSAKRGKCRQERIGLVAANPDNLENDKEAGGEAQGTQALSKKRTSRESVYPLWRLMSGFHKKYHRSPLGRINASGIE